MVTRFPYHNITPHFSPYSVDKIVFLNHNHIAIQEGYGQENNLYQKIGIFDLTSIKLVAKLLPSKCFITNMIYVKDHYLAATYHADSGNYSPSLGIWDIRKILEGDVKPFQNFTITNSSYFPKLLDLSCQKIAFASIPGNTIDVFDFEKKLFSVETKHEFNYSLGLTNYTNGFIAATMDALNNKIGIHIINNDTQNIKKYLSLPVTHSLNQIDFLKTLNNHDMVVGYHCVNTNAYIKTKHLKIWNIDTEEEIKTLSDHLMKIKKFPNDDIVSVAKNGTIEYWDNSFAKYPFEVTLPRDVTYHRSIELIPLDNYGLFIHLDSMINNHPETFMYVPPPLPFLQHQYRIVDMAVNIIAPYSKIPEINQLIHQYLGFFKPKKYCGVDLPEFLSFPRRRESI